MTAVEWLQSGLELIMSHEEQMQAIGLFEQAKEMEKRALAIITKFVKEFDEEGEVSWNTRDEAQNFLTTFK